MLELPHLLLICLSTEDIFFRALRVSSKYGWCPSYKKEKLTSINFQIQVSLVKSSSLFQHFVIYNFTLSNPMRVPSSIGKSCNLIFEEGSSVCPKTSLRTDDSFVVSGGHVLLSGSCWHNAWPVIEGNLSSWTKKCSFFPKKKRLKKKRKHKRQGNDVTVHLSFFLPLFPFSEQANWTKLRGYTSPKYQI